MQRKYLICMTFSHQKWQRYKKGLHHVFHLISLYFFHTVPASGYSDMGVQNIVCVHDAFRIFTKITVFNQIPLLFLLIDFISFNRNKWPLFQDWAMLTSLKLSGAFLGIKILPYALWVVKSNKQIKQRVN